jgi:hypothetical protein
MLTGILEPQICPDVTFRRTASENEIYPISE